MKHFSLLVLGELADRNDFVQKHLSSVMAYEITAEALNSADILFNNDGQCELNIEDLNQIYNGRH